MDTLHVCSNCYDAGIGVADFALLVDPAKPCEAADHAENNHGEWVPVSSFPVCEVEGEDNSPIWFVSISDDRGQVDDHVHFYPFEDYEEALAAAADLNGRETHEQVVATLLGRGLSWEDAVAAADVRCNARTS